MRIAMSSSMQAAAVICVVELCNLHVAGFSLPLQTFAPSDFKVGCALDNYGRNFKSASCSQGLPRCNLGRFAALRKPGMASLKMADYMFGMEGISVQTGDRVFIVGADIKRDKYKTLENSWNIKDSMDELERLCETAGLVVAGRDYQTMQNPNPSTFIGAGKLEEIAQLVRNETIALVIFDDELSPAQGRNIQKAMGAGVQVLDRTQLILQIFSQRARTREAKLQVQAASMKYMLPRLQYFMTEGAGMESRGGGAGGGKGGKGLKGAGETQIEMDKRLFRKQIQRIEEEIEEVKQQRDQYRTKRRERDNLPLVAIVGYTNAGKSTLLNRLCGADEVYADDLLFATLDPTTRKVRLPGGKEMLLTDTVGFIQKLPTKLVTSFRATLEELEDASLVLHVVDCSSPLARQQILSVQGIVEELMVEDTPQIMVLNKRDQHPAAQAAAAAAGVPALPALDSDEWLFVHERVVPETAVAISARDGGGVGELLAAVESALLSLNALVECRLPYSAGELLNEVHKVGTIVEEEFLPDGTRVVAYVPPSLRGRLADFIVSKPGRPRPAKARPSPAAALDDGDGGGDGDEEAELADLL